MKTVNVEISGRKEPGHPTLNFIVNFNTVEELVNKIDELVEKQTDLRKVDVNVDDYDCLLSEGEIKLLNKNWISVY